MKRVYKEIVQDGKALKKLVEEYMTFEFDNDGTIINTITKDEKSLDDYDEFGNRNDIPWCFENSEENFNAEKMQNTEKYETKENGNTEFIIGSDYCCFYWKCKNGTDLTNYNYYFGNNSKDGKSPLFEYDNGLIIHIKNSADEELWLEYEDDKLTHITRSDGTESFFTYENNGNLIKRHDEWISNNDDDNEKESKERDTYFEYNSNGLIEKISYCSKDCDLFVYDSNNNLIKRTNEREIIEWDSNGNIIYEKNDKEEFINQYFNNVLIEQKHIMLNKKEDIEIV